MREKHNNKQSVNERGGPLAMVILIVRWTVNPLVELLILAGSISVAVIHTSEPYPMLNMKMYTWSQDHADHGEDSSFDDG